MRRSPHPRREVHLDGGVACHPQEVEGHHVQRLFAIGHQVGSSSAAQPGKQNNFQRTSARHVSKLVAYGKQSRESVYYDLT